MIDQGPIAVVDEEIVDGDGDLGADIVDRGKGGDVGGEDVVDIAEVFRKSLSGTLADMSDTEAEQDTIKRCGFRFCDLSEEVVGSLLADAFEGQKLVLGQGVDVGDGVDEGFAGGGFGNRLVGLLFWS